MRTEHKPDPVLKAAAIINEAIASSWRPDKKLLKDSQPFVLNNVQDLQGRLSPNGMKMLAKMFPQIITPGPQPQAPGPQGNQSQQNPGNLTINNPVSMPAQDNGSPYERIMNARLPSVRPVQGNNQNVNITVNKAQPAPIMPAPQEQ